MRQATLPDHLEEITISDMLEEESGFTVPWAMWADKNKRQWLNGSYTFHKNPGGTVQLRITRVNGAFNVDASQCVDDKWVSEENPSWDANRLPVAKLE